MNVHSYIHTYIHTRIHTYTRMYIHAHSHALTHTYTHTYIYIYIYRIFQSNAECIPQCQFILDNSTSPYAQVVAISSGNSNNSVLEQF